MDVDEPQRGEGRESGPSFFLKWPFFWGPVVRELGHQATQSLLVQEAVCLRAFFSTLQLAASLARWKED